jgi:RNA polymerase sigma factor (sigma-70 family)
LTANEADAEDVVQDAARDSLGANPEVEGERHATAYMFAAIRSKARRYGRWSGFGGAAESTPWHRSSQAESSVPSPLEIALRVEEDERSRRLLELANQGLERLSPELREALELVVLRDPKMKLREVAEIQGVSVSTVHRRVEKALDALRRIDERASVSLSGDDDDDTG